MSNCTVNINLSNTSFKTCGDIGVNVSNQLATDILDTTTVKDFNDVICSELIDVKSRKVISSYPTLKLLYNRYVNSFNTGTTSSAYNYLKMNSFTKLVGDYWVDLIEQIIPATTMWGSTYKHSNTTFDSQKFSYKKYTLKTCEPPTNIVYPSPTKGVNKTTDIEIIDVTQKEPTGSECLTPTGETTTCGGVYIQQINDGSEFIGTVSSTNEPSTGDTTVIPECDLEIVDIDVFVGIGGAPIIITPTIIGSNGPNTYEWEFDVDGGGEYPLGGYKIVGGNKSNKLELNFDDDNINSIKMGTNFTLKVKDSEGCEDISCIGINTQLEKVKC